MFIRVRSVLHYLWRAVDQNVVVLDMLVQNGEMARFRSDVAQESADVMRGAGSKPVAFSCGANTHVLDASAIR